MDQEPDDFVLPHNSSRINESRRRRSRGVIVPSGKAERSLYLNEVAKRLVPGLDFFAFSALSALAMGAALLFDHPAIYVLAALVAPFMAPLIGLGFSTVVGSFRFLMQSLGSLVIGATFVFISGLLGGWISKLLPDFEGNQAAFFTAFSLPHLILVLVGTIIAIIVTVRTPKQRSLLASVALAYEVYLPVGVAGFGLTSNFPQYFLTALQLAGTNVLLVIIVGAIVLAFMKLRPVTGFGYLLTLLLLAGSIFLLISSSALKTTLPPVNTPTLAFETENLPVPSIMTPSVTPARPTATIPMPIIESTPTNTLVPTRTPTMTITPKPTEIWATINVEVGVYIRNNPCYDDITCPKNGNAIQDKTPVLVLAINEDGSWAQVRVPDDGRQGWLSTSYLVFDQ